MMPADRSRGRVGPVMGAAALLVLFAGCASSGSTTTEADARKRLCPPGLTPSCVEYLGKKMRCFCGTKEDLREIFDPDDGPPR